MDGIRGTAVSALTGDAYANKWSNEPQRIAENAIRRADANAYRQAQLKQKQADSLRNKVEGKYGDLGSYVQKDFEPFLKNFTEANIAHNLNPSTSSYGATMQQRDKATEMWNNLNAKKNKINEVFGSIEKIPDWYDKESAKQSYINQLVGTKNHVDTDITAYDYKLDPNLVNTATYHKKVTVPNIQSEKVTIQQDAGRDSDGNIRTETVTAELPRQIFVVNQNNSLEYDKDGVPKIQDSAFSQIMNNMTPEVHDKTISDAMNSLYPKDMDENLKKQDFYNSMSQSQRDEVIKKQLAKDLSNAYQINYSSTYNTTRKAAQPRSSGKDKLQQLVVGSWNGKTRSSNESISYEGKTPEMEFEGNSVLLRGVSKGVDKATGKNIFSPTTLGKDNLVKIKPKRVVDVDALIYTDESGKLIISPFKNEREKEVFMNDKSRINNPNFKIGRIAAFESSYVDKKSLASGSYIPANLPLSEARKAKQYSESLAIGTDKNEAFVSSGISEKTRQAIEANMREASVLIPIVNDEGYDKTAYNYYNEYFEPSTKGLPDYEKKLKPLIYNFKNQFDNQKQQEEFNWGSAPVKK